MISEIKEIFNEIKSNDIYLDWHGEHKNSYLTSVFIDKETHFDFLDKDTDKITSFRFIDGELNFEESEIFRKERNKIKELDLNDIKFDLSQAEDLVDSVMDNDYRKEEVQKKLIILQVIDVPVWNITYITKALNVLNVKINAINGELINHSFESLLNFKQA